MSWNYRVVRYSDTCEESGSFFLIEEVYYDDDGVTPRSHTVEGAAVGSGTLDELSGVLDVMREALDKPVLDDGNWPNVWEGEP